MCASLYVCKHILSNRKTQLCNNVRKVEGHQEETVKEEVQIKHNFKD